MRMLIRHCIENEIFTSRQVLYISCDDYILGHQSILELIDLFRRIHRHSYDTRLLICIDEITYHPRFEQQLKTLYDSQNVKIYASSSSASMLRQQKALLTGRSRTIEILPLDFKELLEVVGASMAK